MQLHQRHLYIIQQCDYTWVPVLKYTITWKLSSSQYKPKCLIVYTCIKEINIAKTCSGNKITLRHLKYQVNVAWTSLVSFFDTKYYVLLSREKHHIDRHTGNTVTFAVQMRHMFLTKEDKKLKSGDTCWQFSQYHFEILMESHECSKHQYELTDKATFHILTPTLHTQTLGVPGWWLTLVSCTWFSSEVAMSAVYGQCMWYDQGCPVLP